MRNQPHEMCRTLYDRVFAYMTTQLSTLLLIVVLGLPTPVDARSLSGDSSFQNPPPPQIQGVATSVQKVPGKKIEADSKLPDALLSGADDRFPPPFSGSASALTNSILFSQQGRISVCPRAPPAASIFSRVQFSV